MEKDPHHSDQVALICFDAHVFHFHLFSGENWKQEVSGLLHKVDIGQFIDHNGWTDFWNIFDIGQLGFQWNIFCHNCRFTDVPGNHFICHFSHCWVLLMQMWSLRQNVRPGH